MQDTYRLRWAGLLLATGTLLFGAAGALGEPFRQSTPGALYAAIAANATLYRGLSLLATAGYLSILSGFVILTLFTRVMRGTRFRVFLAGLALLGTAAGFWTLEVIFRFSPGSAAMGIPVTGGAEASSFAPAPGAGFNWVFLAFLTCALLGLTLLVWSLGDARLLPPALARLGSMIVLASGTVAVLAYPWLGAVEQAFLYPLALVVLPIAIRVLVGGHQRPGRRTARPAG